MSKPVGSLVVRVGANTSGLSRGGRKMETEMQRWRRQANETSKRMALIGTAAAAAATAITAKLVKGQMRAIDASAKLAARIGEATEEVTGLQHAAELTGAGSEKMAAALDVLQKRLGEAAQGSGEAANALDALGLNVQELIDKRPGEQMRVIAEAMQGLSTQAERNAVASDLFSRANQDLVNTLALGRDGLDEMSQEAKDLGLAFSRVDARQIEAANDAITRVQAALTGATRTLTIELAPVIEAVANRFVAGSKDADGFSSQIINGMENVALAVAPVINSIKVLQTAVKGVQVSFHLAVGVITQGLAEILAANREVNNRIIDGVNKVIEAWNRLGVLQQQTLDQMAPGKMESGLATIASAASSEINRLSDEMGDLAGSMVGFSDIRDKFRLIREESKKAAEEATNAAPGTALPTPGGGEEGDSENEKRREALRERLEMIRKAGLTQTETEQEQFEKRMELLREGKEKELITEQEFRTRKENLEAKHNDRMADLRRRGMSDMEKIANSSLSRQAQATSQKFMDMTAAAAQGNKKMFEINKAAAIANTILSSREAVTDAYTWGNKIGGPPLGAVMAGTAGLAQFARVQQIKSQTFSGNAGGGSSGAGSTASSQTAAGSGQPTQPSGGPQRQANITIQGDNFSGDAVASLAEQLEEFYGDNGGKMNIRRAS